MTRREDREFGRKTSRSAVLAREVKRSIDAWRESDGDLRGPLAAKMMRLGKALALLAPSERGL